jgi:hypothetical protein
MNATDRAALNARLTAVSLASLLTILTTSEDADVVNLAAMDAGLFHDRAALFAADLEAGRTLTRARLAERLRSEDRSLTNAEKAENAAKEHPDYLEYVARVRAHDEDAKAAERLRRALETKAERLGRIGRVVATA